MSSDDDAFMAWLDHMSALSRGSAPFSAVEAVLGPDSDVGSQPLSAFASVPVLCAPEAEPSLVDDVSAPEGFQETKDVMALWALPMRDALMPIFSARGSQVYKPQMMSTSSGCCSEAPGLPRLGIDADHIYCCDSYEGSFNFITANGPTIEHFFLDNKELAEGNAYCAIHKERCVHKLDPKKHKHLTSGFSCRGFSTAFSGRFSEEGAFKHGESDHMYSMVDQMLRDDAGTATAENVWGFILKAGRHQVKSPLEIFLEYAQVKAPNYFAIVYFVDGGAWLRLPRKRIYITFFHTRVGGAAAAQRQSTYVKVRLSRLCWCRCWVVIVSDAPCSS